MNACWKGYLAATLVGAAGGAGAAASMKKHVGGGAAVGAVSGLLVFAAGDAADTFTDKAKAAMIADYKAKSKLAKAAAKEAGKSAPAAMATAGGTAP